MPQGDAEKIRIDFRETDASERVARSIVLLTGEALGRLLDMGYKRDRHVRIDVHEDGLPVTVLLRERPIYTINFAAGVETPYTLMLEGTWLDVPPKRTLWDRILRR